MIEGFIKSQYIRRKLASLFLLTGILQLTLCGCALLFPDGGKARVISLEVKEKMGAYLTEKYGKTFVVEHIDFNQSSASPNVIYSSYVWPEQGPEVVFRCTLDSATGEFMDEYPDADLGFREKEEVTGAFESKTHTKIALLRRLRFPVPVGHDVILGDSLDETFDKNPGAVSLSLSVLIEAESVDADSVTEGLRAFIDDYVRGREYNYLTLRIWFMPPEALKKYHEDIENGMDSYDPPDNKCSAVFAIVMPVSKIDSSRLADHLSVFRR